MESALIYKILFMLFILIWVVLDSKLDKRSLDKKIQDDLEQMEKDYQKFKRISERK